MQHRAIPVVVLALLLARPARAVDVAPTAVLAPRDVLRRDGPWVRDGWGRVVMLRGMNYSGLEFGNFIGDPYGPEEADFDTMASWGTNVVRLAISWQYLEPTPGAFEESYLAEQVDPVLVWARRRSMRVVIELHQYLWSPCVGGIGMPAWTCAGMSYPPDVTGAFQAQHDFWAGALAPDGRTLVDHFLEVWRRVIRRYRGWTTVIGFEPLNEPLDIDAIGTFEHDTLYPFYRRFVGLVRGLSAPQLIVLEPPVTRNLGLAAQPEPVGDPNLLYAPHLYTTTGGLDTLPYTGDRDAVDADYALAAAEAAVQGAALWVGEYGGNVDRFPAETELFFHDSLEEQDERLVGSAGWAYFPGGNVFSVVDRYGHAKGQLGAILAHPYPRQTAGTPLSFSANESTAVVRLRFAEDRTRLVADPTLVYVPIQAAYPRGVVVTTTPGDVAVVDASRNRVAIWRSSLNDVHEVEIRPVP